MTRRGASDLCLEGETSGICEKSYLLTLFGAALS